MPEAVPVRPPELASQAYKWTLGIALALLQSALYFGIGHAPFARSTELLRLRLDDAIPFWPWTVWCYLPFYAAIFVMAIGGIRRRALFNGAARGVAVVMLLGAAGHLLVAAEYPRPPVTPPYGSASLAFVGLVQRIDAPGCVFPSLHVAQTTMLATLLLLDRPVLGKVAVVMATMLALSTLTIKQHFVADVAAGYALAFVGRAVALRSLAPQPAPI
jgi:membrane-associated phospholipid phosphatase